MKKTLCLTLAVLTCLTVFAQGRKYNVKAFTGVDMSGLYNVEINYAPDCAVSVETDAELYEFLDVYVSNNGVLHLDMVDGGIPKAIQRKLGDIKIKASVAMPLLNSLEMSGVTRCYVPDAFKAAAFELDMSGVSKAEFADLKCTTMDMELSGVSDLKWNGTVEELDVEASGSSKVNFTLSGRDITYADVEASGACNVFVEGKAIKASVDISGACRFDGEQFPVETMRIDVSGAGKATVRVLGTLEPQVSGAAKLRYNKEASLRNLITSGSANITTY